MMLIITFFSFSEILQWRYSCVLIPLNLINLVIESKEHERLVGFIISFSVLATYTKHLEVSDTMIVCDTPLYN